MSRLLHKPLKVFALYAFVIMACSVPAYYYIVDSIWMEELDEHNEITCRRIAFGFNQLKLSEQELEKRIALWNEVQPASPIRPQSGTFSTKDSVYSVKRKIFDDGEWETENFRGLLKVIVIKGKTYRISSETNVEEAEDTVWGIALMTCFFIGTLITGFILLNKRISKRLWKPFYESIELLRDFDLNGQKNISFKPNDIHEFNELNEALNKLIEGNIRTYSRQKEFTQNASHELQTPLALIRSKIDLLIQDETLSAQQRQVIESLSHSLSRITRINKNLLLLSKIENQTYPSDLVDLSSALASSIRQTEEHLQNKALSLTQNIRSDIRVQANEGLVEVLIMNLLLNAIRHNLNGGQIIVSLNERSLSISNSGSIALNPELLFKRFMTSSAETPTSGLGLAIVKQISELYGWKISYAFENNFHIFDLKF